MIEKVIQLNPFLIGLVLRSKHGKFHENLFKMAIYRLKKRFQRQADRW